MVNDGGTADGGADATADGDEREAGGTPVAPDIERACALLDDDDLSAFHLGVIRDGAVETAFAHRTDGADAEGEGLRALTLLAAHVRVVAEAAGVDPATAAADAAALVDRIEEPDRSVAGDG